MLTHPTVEKLQQLRCAGMAKALAEQFDSSEVQALSFEERLGLLVDRELTERYSRQLTNRLRRAKLKHDACIEDIDFRHRRGLDKQLVLSLADGRWVREHLNVLICGPTGIGKSWIGCALAHSACRNGHSALYVRVSRLLSALAIARADGRYPKLLESLAKTEVLVSRVEGRRVTSRESVALPALSHRAAVRVPWARFLPPLSEPGVPISGTGLSSGIMRLAHGLSSCDQRAGLASRGTRLTPWRWPAGASSDLLTP